MMKGEVSLGVDGKFVHVNLESTLSDHVSIHVIHKHLEGGWCVAETKEHDSGFEEAKGSDEGSLSLVTFANANVVIFPLDVKFHKEGGVFVSSMSSEIGRASCRERVCT